MTDLLGWVVAAALSAGVVVASAYAGNRIWNHFYEYPGDKADHARRLKALRQRSVVTLLAELITLPVVMALVVLLDGPRSFVVLFLAVLVFSSINTFVIIIATNRRTKSYSR